MVDDREDSSGENVRVPPPPRHEAMLMESLNRYTAAERIEKITEREKDWRKELFAALQPVEEPELVLIPKFNRRQSATMQQVFKKRHLARWLAAKSIPEPAVRNPVDPRLRRV